MTKPPKKSLRHLVCRAQIGVFMRLFWFGFFMWGEQNADWGTAERAYATRTSNDKYPVAKDFRQPAMAAPPSLKAMATEVIPVSWRWGWGATFSKLFGSFSEKLVFMNIFSSNLQILTWRRCFFALSVMSFPALAPYISYLYFTSSNSSSWGRSTCCIVLVCMVFFFCSFLKYSCFNKCPLVVVLFSGYCITPAPTSTWFQILSSGSKKKRSSILFFFFSCQNTFWRSLNLRC